MTASITALEGIIADTLQIPRTRVRRASRVMKDRGVLSKHPHRGGRGEVATATDAAALVLAMLAPTALGIRCGSGGRSAEVVRAVEAARFGAYAAWTVGRGPLDRIFAAVPLEFIREQCGGGVLGNIGVSGTLVSALEAAQIGGVPSDLDLETIEFSRALGVPLCELMFSLRRPYPLPGYPGFKAVGMLVCYAEIQAFAALEAERGSAGGKELIENKRSVGLMDSASIARASIERIGQALGPLPADQLADIAKETAHFADAGDFALTTAPAEETR